MGTQIDAFCEDLRINLTMMSDDLRVLKAKALGKAPEVERAIRQQVDTLQKKIDESNAAVEAAKPKVDEWIQTQRTAAQSKIAEWKAKGDAKNLQLRASMADAYADAMSVIASSAVDKAAKAALEALLAHNDLDASTVAQTVGKS